MFKVKNLNRVPRDIQHHEKKPHTNYRGGFRLEP